ncbi:hypothetical protein GL213_13960 [Halogeometricum borinquense]|nr:hypothetical protein GL213_13960 [Halogeometricum borinquense]
MGDWIAWSDGEGIVEAVDFRVTLVAETATNLGTTPSPRLSVPLRHGAGVTPNVETGSESSLGGANRTCGRFGLIRKGRLK